VDAAELQQFLASRLSRFKVPEQLWVSAEPLPKLGTGKIDRVTLKQHYRAVAAGG
jgi:steroid-24-oyl-CoA synthetase